MCIRDRLTAAGLPVPTLQVVREIGRRRIVRADAVYRDPDIAIFLDGRAYHAQTLEKILDDLEQRNRLEQWGECVLEFTYQDVMDRFDDVAEAVRRALKEVTEDPSLDVHKLPGIVMKAEDSSRRRATLIVDPQAWIADENTRASSLSSANRLRLAGWRLRREARIV